MTQLILGLTGQAGCGKGTIAEFLEEEYGAIHLRFSAILDDLLQTLGLENDRPTLTQLSETIRKGFGESVLSHAIAKQALTSSKKLVVIDGFRRVEDLTSLETLPEFKLLALDAPARVRYERVKNRGEREDEKEMSWEKFISQGSSSTELTIPATMARAWRTMDNSGTKEEMKERMRELMKELGVKAMARK
jgi:dephospho-CoA kinase